MKEWLQSQLVDDSYVKPEHRYVGGKFYFNSSAGLLCFRPKTEKQVIEFRDKFVNRFELISNTGRDRKAFFVLYEDVKKSYGFWQTTYKANLRTRIFGRVAVLYSQVLN